MLHFKYRTPLVKILLFVCLDTLSLDAPHYVEHPEVGDSTNEDDENPIPIHKRELAKRIYKKTHATWPVNDFFVLLIY